MPRSHLGLYATARKAAHLGKLLCPSTHGSGPRDLTPQSITNRAGSLPRVRCVASGRALRPLAWYCRKRAKVILLGSQASLTLKHCPFKSKGANVIGPLRSLRRYVRSHTHIAHATHPAATAHAAAVPLVILGQFGNHRIGREHQSRD